MFNELDLENCPEKFAFNCKRYEIECHNCKANNNGKYLKYIPIDKSIQNHPAGIKQKKKGVASYSRKGRSNELKIIKQKDYLNKTVASGSIAGDGDAKLILSLMNPVPVEIKTRYTDKGGQGPTRSEVVEGLNQNTQLWIIEHKINNCCYYYLIFDLFVNIQKTIFMSSNINCISTYTDTGYTSYRYTVHQFGDKAGKIYEHYIRDIKCKSMYNKKFKDSYNMKINLITNSLGQFVMMPEGVFDELYTLYSIAISH